MGTLVWMQYYPPIYYYYYYTYVDSVPGFCSFANTFAHFDLLDYTIFTG